MADEKEAAASSTAVAEPIEVEDLTSEQRDIWLKTGDRPAKEPAAKKEESATSKPAVEADGKKAESGTADKNEKRWNELLRERKEEKQRADRLEAEIAELRKTAAGAKKEETAPTEKPEAPARPKRADFASDELYEKAYEEEYLPKKQAFDAATKAFEAQQAEINERQKGLLGSWKGIADKGKEIYGEADWRKVTDSYKDFQIFAGDPFEVQLRSAEPDLAARFMQYMSLKPEDVKRIMKLPIREQFKELDALETALRSELGGKKEPEKKAEPEPPKKDKEITAAGRPPRESGGTAAAGGDEAEAALQRGDGESYRRIMNERDIAKRKRARGR